MTTYTFSTLDDPLGTEGTHAIGINDEGQIVGCYYDSSDFMHGFLATGFASTFANAYTCVTLDNLFGTERTHAISINGVGQIATCSPVWSPASGQI